MFVFLYLNLIVNTYFTYYHYRESTPTQKLFGIKAIGGQTNHNFEHISGKEGQNLT